jgi:hypothetical protein
MTETRVEQIKGYHENTNSNFTDYTRFEGVDTECATKKAAFLEEREYTSCYDYPKLDGLIDDQKLTEKKTQVYEAVLELEAAKNESSANHEEPEIYAAYHELRLKKIMLVEAARNLHTAHISGEWEVALLSGCAQ